MKCFKVVRSVYKYGGGTRLVSSFVEGAARVEYEIGKLTTPPDWLKEKGHGILAYATLEDVASLYLGKNAIVLECAVMGAQRELPQFCNTSSLAHGEYKPCESTEFPERTVMFDGVIPMREVPMSEVRAVAPLEAAATL